MTAYYVSGKNGNDGYAGNSSAPWKTIGHAIATVLAGDSVWIAPGRYKTTITLATSGTSGSKIIWKGDPNLLGGWQTNEDYGPVIISGEDANGYEQSVTVVNFNAKSYNEFYDIHAIGGGKTPGNYGWNGNGAAGAKCERCTGTGSRGFYVVATCSYCIGYGLVAFQNCNSSRCVAFGGYYGFYLGTQDQCIGFGGYSVFFGGIAKNCMSVGGLYGFFNGESGSGGNNIALVSEYGLRSGNGTSDNGHEAWFCYDGYNGSFPNPNTGCFQFCCEASTRAGNEIRTPTPIAPMEMIRLLSRALQFDYQNDRTNYVDGSNTTAETTDIIGGARETLKGAGPFSLVNRTETWAKSVRINLAGEILFFVPIVMGIPHTLSVSTTCALAGGSLYPQMEIRGDGITTQTDTALSSPDTLTVTITPTQDTVVTVALRARETSAGAYATFGGITCT
jgi:hypothetical protein